MSGWVEPLPSGRFRAVYRAADALLLVDLRRHRLSADKSLSNLGYTGTVTLTSSVPSTDANNPAATLTASLSKTLPTPYYLSIYDDTGYQLTCTSAATSALNQNVAPPNGVTRTYTAYVAQGCPGSGPPTNDVRSTSSKSLSNLGYTGTVVLTASAAHTTVSSPTSTLTATLSKPLPAAYRLAIRDDRGLDVACTGYEGQSTFTAAVSPPTARTRVYTADVGVGCPVSAVTATSNSVSVTNFDIDVPGSIALLAAGVSLLADPCIEMFPAGPPSSPPSSLNQYQQTCEAERAVGKTWEQVLQLVVDSAGPAVLITAIVAMHDGGDQVGAPPRPAYENPGAPQLKEPNPAPPAFDGPLVVGGGARLLERTRLTGYGSIADPDPEGTARAVYRQCLRLASFATTGLSFADCDTMPIFVPGADIPQATEHDFDVIWQSPRVVQLTAMTKSERQAAGLAQQWYDRVPYVSVCGPSPRPTDEDGDTLQCDEYPFYASEEAGPQEGQMYPEQLRLIKTAQNAREGTLVEGFRQICGLLTPPPSSQGRKYLVIPLPSQSYIPTTGYCRPGSTS